MASPAMTEEYRPPWCPHVVGRYSPRVIEPETGLPGEQRFVITCENCNAVYGPAPCTSGMVRQHVSNFAQSHAHKKV